MTAQSTERLSACQKATPGRGRKVCASRKAARISRQKAASCTNPSLACFFVFLVPMIFTLLYLTPVYGSTLQLQMQDNLLSLKAADANLSTILQRLGQAADIEFKFPKELEKKITLQFSDVSLEIALKRILKGLNYALVYSAAGNGDSFIISAVYIFGKEKGGGLAGQSTTGESGAQHSISDYEKRIKVVQRLLDKARPDSRAGRLYQMEIENYRRLIKRLKIRGDEDHPSKK